MKRDFIIAGYAGHKSLANMREEDVKKLTHLNVAFGHVRDDEISTAHMEGLDRLPAMKANHPGLTVLLSVGGWSAGGFSEAAATEQSRMRFAESAVAALEHHPFDGIDLDWEYPCYGAAGITASPDDKRNFTLLLQAVRERLDEKGRRDGRHYPLTIAAGADRYYIDGTEMEQVAAYVDFVQLMTYDMRGGFQILTGHHTNLYTSTGDLSRISVDASVRLFRQAGVPPEKLVIGAAFYSRMWKGVPDRGRGLHQMAGSPGGYGPNYGELAEKYINKDGFVRYWDEEAHAPFLFNGETFITYDDPRSIGHKCEYVKSNRLAGIMFWEYECDNTYTLLDAMYTGLTSNNQ